jgi:lysyl endopeptidase
MKLFTQPRLQGAIPLLFSPKRCLLLILTIFSFCWLQGQVTTNFNNKEQVAGNGKFNRNYTAIVDVELPEMNIRQLQEKEYAASKGSSVKPLRIAEPIPVDIDVANAIRWSSADGFAYGKYTLRLKGALSASINFDRFYLPEGTEMYVYNENGAMITGPVTAAENNEDAIWGSWVYKGSMITIEIKTPAATRDLLRLHTNNVAYGYKEIYKVIDFGASGACNINVLCPLGNGWDGERNAVALTLGSTGSTLCSGSMVMNTCNNNRPYFLTANHCFVADGNAASWRFTFQAWSATCTPSQNNNGLTFNGSTLRARNAASDFCLVELNTTPPANSNIHYAGWNRNTAAATQATAIHHPRGDVMKISRADNGTTVGSFGGTNNQHWRADWSPQNNGAGATVTAVTEPGSSGSPLFDQDHRIVGQLHGGPSACGAAQLWDFYGRFDLSWTGGGTSATRLRDWLDPTNGGATTTNTTNISILPTATNPGSLSISGPAQLCSPGTVTLTLNGVPAGTPVTWTSGNTGVATISGSSTTATVTWTNVTGSATFTASVGCPASVAFHGIEFGTLIASDIYGIDPGVYPGAGATLQVSVYEGASSYNWSVGGAAIIGDPTGPTIYIKLDGCFPGQEAMNNLGVAISLGNGCGLGPMYWENTFAICGGPSPDWRVANQTRGVLNLQFNGVTPNKSTSGNKKITARLFSLAQGVFVKEWTFMSGQQQYRLPITGIAKGAYVLQLIDGSNKSAKQLFIE